MSPPATPPVTLVVAAGVHTLTPGGQTGARALLVGDGRIRWVGADPRAAPPHEQVADFDDAWVTPAFVDAHVHGTATGLALTGVPLDGVRSVAEVLDRVRRHAQAHPDPVLLGSGWDDFGWPDPRPPRAGELARAAPGRTVLLSRVDAHSCVVDPGTLARLPLAQLAGVDRDPHGAPTGWLREQASEAARREVMGRLPAAQLEEARAATCARAAALGIASLHEMGHPGLSGLDDALAWAAGDRAVEVLVWWAELDADAGPRHGLRVGGDLFLDGSLGSHTAAVRRPYRDSGGDGELFHRDEAVGAFFTAATRAGRGAGVHAIGGRAVEQALVALEAAAAACGAAAVRASRHRLEHVEELTPAQCDRMAALGVTASVQPAFDAAWGGPDGLYAQRFGTDAALRTNPLSWLAAAGCPLAFSSDSPVTPLDPWGTVHAAEHHRGGLGLDRAAAVAAHTLGGRWVAGQDDVGALGEGARADLAVWSADPFTVHDPRTLVCRATMVAGRFAHPARA